MLYPTTKCPLINFNFSDLCEVSKTSFFDFLNTPPPPYQRKLGFAFPFLEKSCLIYLVKKVVRLLVH